MPRPTAPPEAQESAPLLKNLLDAQVLAQIADAAVQVHPAFDRKAFLARTRRGLDGLSIMARIAHAADGLRAHLPEDVPRALALLRRMAPHAPRGLPGLVLPEFVGRHGLDHFDLSLDALRELTPYSSAEFAVRPFLAQDPATALAHALRWAEDDNDHVRRLASEGTRPRLPWARRLPLFIAEPRHALPILERLRADPSDYVRRSVANHLNDIAKDHPEWMLDLLASWPTDQPETGWIAKHALRNLIKAGHPRALGLIGASADAQVALDHFKVKPATLQLGERLHLSLALRSTARETQNLVVDYAIHYVKKNGETSRKVFKWRTLPLDAGATLTLDKQQTVQDYTTRKHYPGVHTVEVLVNGVTVGTERFRLVTD
ncbi:DNA alkylation repair protein [Hylemonella gracilis]|uniref:DNA alkylation repair protein n=1 Tax=Hylemonella gracilis TaxID=80880 RepID=A0A4P6UMX8_9BURK|nr:DNA alkylation repair protein [Hylemonella gracilis]QBK06632.1 DNA alkylation repair protein [Hylemonella gracilis]